MELSVEPRLGKMVLYGVLFKCLDPIVTIACMLSYRDPCKWTILFRQREREGVGRREGERENEGLTKI